MGGAEGGYGFLDGNRAFWGGLVRRGGGAARVCGAEPGAVCAARRGCVRRGVLGWVWCAGGHFILRTEPVLRPVLVVRSAYFPETVHRTVFSNTLDLQGFAPPCAPPSHSAPNQSFGLLRCSAWPILLGQSIGLFLLKRSCSRAAPLRVNPQGEGFWGHGACIVRGCGIFFSFGGGR